MTRPTWNADEHAADRPHDDRGHDPDDPTHRDLVEHEPNPSRRGRWLSAAIVVLGVVAILGAVATDPAAGRLWNDALAGAALVALGGYNAYRRSRRQLGSVGVASLASVVGLWLLASPFLFGPETGLVAARDPTGVAITAVVGLLAFGLGTYSAIAALVRRRDADARPTAVYDRRGQ